MKYLKLFFLTLLLGTSGTLAQDLSEEALEKLEAKQLHDLFLKVLPDTVKAERVARFFLEKSRRKGDTIAMARAYYNLGTSSIFGPEKILRYADTVISLTRNFDHPIFPGRGYTLRAHQHYYLKDLVKCVEDFEKAFEIYQKRGDIASQAHVLTNLTELRRQWGDPNEAMALQKKLNALHEHPDYKHSIRIASADEEEYQSHLRNHELSNIKGYVEGYITLGKLDSASLYLKKGLEKSKGFKVWGGGWVDFHTIWVTIAAAQIDLYSHRYISAISRIDSLLAQDLRPNVREEPLFIFELQLLKGLSYLGMDGHYEQGISFLRKADSIYEANDIQVVPYQRILFEKLLAHHKIRDDTEKRIEYLNKLLHVDSIFKINYQYFDPKMIEKFETPLLMAEKEALIVELEQRNRKSVAANWWVGGFLGVCILFLGYYVRLQRRYKKRFMALMANGDRPMDREDGALRRSGKREVPPDISEMIQGQLESFKKERGFLSQDVSLQGLAKSFGTNSNYLSKVINGELGKSFSTCINDLRVDYMFRKLRDDPRLRRYTIKALAHESGFKSAESFSKAFYKLYGIYPSYYLAQLDKIMEEGKTPVPK